MIDRPNIYNKGKGKLNKGKHSKKQNIKRNKEIYNKKHIRVQLLKINKK